MPNFILMGGRMTPRGRFGWSAAGIALLLLLVFTIGGCSTQMKWFGAGGVECEWDEINYKAYKAHSLSPAAGGDTNDLRHQAEESMRRAEEEQKQLEFGACSENDLANHTCH